MAGAELGSSSTKSEPNVVPLCDILLVLLIIFMVVTPMINKGVNVQLPEAVNTADQPEPGQLLTVSLKENGDIYLDDKKIEDLSKLPIILDEKFEERQIVERKVLLRADIDLEYGKVIDVMNQIKYAQVEVIGLITEQYTSD